MRNPSRRALAALLFLSLPLDLDLQADEKAVFSGPQAGEKTTPFKTLRIDGSTDGKERDPIAENGGAPTLLVFLHGVERSMVPLVTVLDQYGIERKEKLRTELVFLSSDPVESRHRLPLVRKSIQLQAPVGLSLDGPEGPGNYGLNKECLLTVLVAKENRVLANFALVQPGIADAPRILQAVARAIDDPSPPSAEELRARRSAAAGPAAREAASKEEMAKPGGVDLARFDLNTTEGLRAAVVALAREVNALRKEVSELRSRGKREQPGR